MQCDGCSRTLTAVKYTCLQCTDIVFCVHCQRGGIHNHHTTVEVNSVSTHGSHHNQSPEWREGQGSLGDKKIPIEFQSIPNLPYGIVPVAPPIAQSSMNPSFVDTKPTQDPFTKKWLPVESNEPFARRPLCQSDQEYKDVMANMIDADGLQWEHKVKEISRIENHGMYNIYKACKDEMDKHNGRGFQNERILWHGTSADVLGNIYRGGFNRSYCGKNGQSATAYGDGVYFATMFKYSASPTYSPPDSKGQKYIFQCRVLTGHYTQGQSGLKEPPMRTLEQRYDSVVDKATDPSIFVIFKDMQVYPEYVITLTA